MLYLGLFLVVMPIIPFVVYIKIFKIVDQSRRSSVCTNSSEHEMQNLRSLPILANGAGNLTALARTIKKVVLWEKKRRAVEK